jgi:hypothetical protein
MTDRGCILKQLAIVLVAGLAVVLLAGGVAAKKSYVAKLQKLYALDEKLAKCEMCHAATGEPDKGNLNAYGKAVRTAKRAAGNATGADKQALLETALRNVEAVDSDGDGATNGEELALGTWPGDAKSTPAKEALEKYRKEHAAKAVKPAPVPETK